MPEQNKNIIKLKKYEQYRAVDELISRSQPNIVYYTLLILSSFIVSAGLLVNNASIVIGGMLVTPVLTPVLLIALGLSIGEINTTKRTSIFVGKSFLVVVAAAAVLGFVFGVNGNGQPDFLALDDTLRGGVLYFIVALAAGAAATFAWVRKEISEILPGIAIAVSLVPPLSLMGIGISLLSFEVVRFNFFLVFFNLIGILVGSAFVFSILKFHRVEQKIEKEEKRAEQESQARV